MSHSIGNDTIIWKNSTVRINYTFQPAHYQMDEVGYHTYQPDIWSKPSWLHELNYETIPISACGPK